MEMKQLIFFKRTAELEHMTKAAEQLMVAQPFLSKTIASLEEELGIKLFNHVGRQIQLNQYGVVFYQRVQNIFSELRDAQKELDNMAGHKEQEIFIVTNTSLYMPGMLTSFRRKYPTAQFHQASARRFRIIKMLHSGEADFAVCTPPLYEDPDLETTVLIHEVCPIIYPPDHWLKWRTGVNLKDVQNESFISAIAGYGIRDLAESFFQAADIHPKIIVESTDTSAVPNFVKNGLGIAFSPLTPLLKDPVLRTCYVKVIDPPCIGIVGLTWKRGRYLTRACKQFHDFATEYFASIDPNRPIE